MTTAKPVSTNFNDQIAGATALPLTLNGFVFEPVSSMMNIPGPVQFVDYGGSTGIALSIVSINHITAGVYTFHSEVLANKFQLVSMYLPQFLEAGFMIQGLSNGQVVASDIVSGSLTENAGSVAVTLDPNQINRGTLTFNADWSNIDTVKFYGNHSGTGIEQFAIDEIVLRSYDIKLDAGSDSGIAGDNITKDATPVLTGTATANAVVDIFLDGASAAIASVTADANGKFEVTSAGLDDGTHTFSATTQGTTENATVTITVDTHADAPIDLSLASGTPQSDYTPTINGKAEANAEVTLYEGTEVLGIDTADAQGNWSITSKALSDGDHLVTAVQVDVAGNMSGASADLTVTVQTGRPGAPVLADAADSGTKGDNITNVKAPTLTGTSAANATVFLREGSTIVGQGTADSNGKWSITTDVELQHGEHVLKAAVLDMSGFAPSSIPQGAQGVPAPQYLEGPALTVTIDTEAPAAPGGLILAAASDSGAPGDGVTSDATPTVIGTASANATVTLYEGSSELGEVQADANGKWSFTTAVLSEGSHTLSAVQSDAAGNISLDTTETFTIDTHAAAPAGLALASGTLPSDYTPTVTGTAEAYAEVKLYEGSTLLGTDIADGKGNWWITSGTLSDGQHLLTVVQQDVAGNLSDASDELTVNVQTGRPGAPVLADAADSGVKGDNVTNVKTPTLTGTAAANAAVFLREGSTIVGQGQASSDGKWSITTTVELQHGEHVLTAAILDPNTHIPDSLPPGAQAIMLEQYLAGPALTITIDTEAPAAPAGLALALASDSGTKGDGKTTVATPTVTGTANAHATVTLLDGERVLGTAQANADGDWSISSAALAKGVHALTAVQSDVAGNISSSSTVLNVTIEAKPVAETPVTTVDGVNVGITPVTLPGGGSGTAVTVPVVTPGRVEQNGGSSTADIPLSTQGGTALVTAQVHTGTGLSASGGTSQGAELSLAQLIAAIKATGSSTGSTDTGGMTGGGDTFLSYLPASGALLVQTVQLSGEGNADFVAGQATGTPVAIVLDGTQLPARGTVTLTDIPFAAVFGGITVSGSTANQILTGDGAGQTFIVSTGAGGSVLAGGGTDVLQFGIGSSAGGNAAVSGGDLPSTTTLLHGGSAADTAVFKGAAADYTVEQHDGFLLVASKAAPDQVAKVVNVEALKFDDSTLTVDNRAALTTLAGLYENVLGRQADVDGFAYWAGVEGQGASLGTIALQLITSAEGVASFGALNGNAAHDVAILYQGIFNRAADAAGQAYWADQVAHGATLANVAEAMTQSAEIVGHQIAATDWNFAV